MIEVIDVSKKFKKYHDKATTLKERLLFLRSSKVDTFWALQNISIEIQKGETVGAGTGCPGSPPAVNSPVFPLPFCAA